jgi:hypothetical protein
MRFRYLVTVVITLLANLMLSSAVPAAEPAVTAFVHVNVVPMDSERVLRDQTVIVRNGIISEIGSNLALPSGTTLIGGGGKFLLPGLADMHTHSESREDMKVYLANGVTTVLNLGGASSDFIDQRVPSLNRGERPGPHVYVALRIDGTPQFGQFVVKTPEEARWAVRLAKTNGYRFIKVYNNLSAGAFAAAADEARKQRLGLAGHHLEAVPLETEIEGGEFLVAHLEELMYGLFKPPADDPLAAPPEAAIAKAVEMLRRNHAFVVADLFTFQTIAEQWGRPDVVAVYLERADTRYLPFHWRLEWWRDDYDTRKGSLTPRAKFLARLANALNDARIPIVAGTDAPTIPGIVPGFSLHDDLDRLVAAGFTRFQALSAATRTPGEFIGKAIHDSPPFGEVKPGYRADLMLSDADPLEDLTTLRTPAGVMSHGRWYDRRDLKGLLDGVRSDYAAAAAVTTH